MHIVRAITQAIGFFLFSALFCTVAGFFIGILLMDKNDVFAIRPMLYALIGLLIGIIAGGWYAVNKH